MIKFTLKSYSIFKRICSFQTYEICESATTSTQVSRTTIVRNVCNGYVKETKALSINASSLQPTFYNIQSRSTATFSGAFSSSASATDNSNSSIPCVIDEPINLKQRRRDNYIETWMRTFKAFQRYLDEFKTSKVTQNIRYKCIIPGGGDNGADYTYDGKLGIWLNSQRIARKRGDLLPELAAHLQGLVDTGRLKWTIYHDWSRHFQALTKHCQENSAEDSSTYYYTFKLGAWLNKQLTLRQQGKLRPEREALLQSFVDKGILHWKAPYDADSKIDNSLESSDKLDHTKPIIRKRKEKYLLITWMRTYKALLKFKQEHGTANINQYDTYKCVVKDDDGTEYNYKGRLGIWLNIQRVARKRGNLQPEMEKYLQRLVDEGCLDWEINDDWNLHFAALKKYGEEFGHFNVPQLRQYKCKLVDVVDQGVIYNYNKMLGRWLNVQRGLKKRRLLDSERQKMLQILVDTGHLKWSTHLEWPVHYAALVEFARIHGHCNVRTNKTFTCVLRGQGDDGSNFSYSSEKLRKWLLIQKRMNFAGKLEKTKRDKLQELVNQGLLSWRTRPYKGSNRRPT